MLDFAGYITSDILLQYIKQYYESYLSHLK